MKQYIKIYSELKDAILNEEFPPQSSLPSENTLAKMYNVSRETVRKALKLLADNGYIQKRAGRKSTVIDRSTFNLPVSQLSSYKEVAQSQGIDVETTVVSLKKTVATIHHPFYPFNGQEVWCSSRIRLINGEAVILDKDYLSADIIPSINQCILQQSLFDYIEKDLGMDIDYANKEITVEPVTKEDEHLLNLRPEDQVVVVVRSQVFLKDTRMFEYSESRHRIDKFVFHEFSRRQKL